VFHVKQQQHHRTQRHALNQAISRFLVGSSLADATEPIRGMLARISPRSTRSEIEGAARALLEGEIRSRLLVLLDESSGEFRRPQNARKAIVDASATARAPSTDRRERLGVAADGFELDDIDRELASKRGWEL